MNKPRRVRLLVGLILLAALAATTLYTVYDNQRFIVVEQEIRLDRLPESFDGFRILQISDLHGSYFGKNQQNLVRAINALDYDLLALTGDMNASTAGSSLEDSRAVLALLDGITNKETVFWIDGNSGPTAIGGAGPLLTGQPTAIGRLLQEKGCRLLIAPTAITRGADKIWITPELSEAMFSSMRSSLEDEAFLAQMESVYGLESLYEKAYPVYQETYAAFQAIKGSDEVKIMLGHYPRQINLSAEEIAMMGELDYDLILAGHYHGGQLRLPLLGALYIPSPTTGINNSGFFPAPAAVKGLSYFGDTPQYVSAGLGASGHTRLLSFRLFNTPEINLLTLRSR